MNGRETNEMVRLQEVEVEKVHEFKHLGSSVFVAAGSVVKR